MRVLAAAPGDPSVLGRVGMLVKSPADCPYLSGQDDLRVAARHASAPDGRVKEAPEVVDLTHGPAPGCPRTRLG